MFRYRPATTAAQPADSRHPTHRTCSKLARSRLVRGGSVIPWWRVRWSAILSGAGGGPVIPSGPLGRRRGAVRLSPCGGGAGGGSGRLPRRQTHLPRPPRRRLPSEASQRRWRRGPRRQGSPPRREPKSVDSCGPPTAQRGQSPPATGTRSRPAHPRPWPNCSAPGSGRGSVIWADNERIRHVFHPDHGKSGAMPCRVGGRRARGLPDWRITGVGSLARPSAACAGSAWAGR